MSALHSQEGGGGMHEKINMNTASLHINQSTQWPLIVMIILRN